MGTDGAFAGKLKSREQSSRADAARFGGTKAPGNAVTCVAEAFDPSGERSACSRGAFYPPQSRGVCS